MRYLFALLVVMAAGPAHAWNPMTLSGTAGAAPAGVTYSINCPFTSVSDDTCANGDVIGTDCGDATACSDGTLTVVDEGTGVASFSSNEMVMTGDTVTLPNHGLLGTGFTREIGKTFMVDTKVSTVNYHFVAGWASTNDIFANDGSTIEVGWQYRAGGTPNDLVTWTDGSFGWNVVDYAVDTYYPMAFVLGGYSEDINDVPYRNGFTASSYDYGASYFMEVSGVWRLYYREANSDTGTMYPAATEFWNTGTANLDNFKVPGEALTSLWIHDAYDSFTDTTSTALTSHTPDIDGGAGGWIGRDCWTNDAWQIDTNQAELLTAGTSGCSDNTTQDYIYIDTGESDIWAELAVNCDGDASLEQGLYFRGEADDVGDGINALLYYIESDGSTCDWVVDECVDGTCTQLSTDTAFNAADGYDHFLRLSTDGTTVVPFINAFAAVYLTESDHELNTWVGLWNGQTANIDDKTFDNFAVSPRGTDGEYDAIFDLY